VAGSTQGDIDELHRIYLFAELNEAQLQEIVSHLFEKPEP
jgi:hypothetical protein